MVAVLIISVLLSGVSLAIDAFAVSVCDGMVFRNLNKVKAVSIPLTFGIFQAIMPIIGFYIGTLFAQFEKFDLYDHWIAFALLAILGGKMIFDGIKDLKSKKTEEIEVKNFSYVNVLIQGVATSIDALFFGFTLNTIIGGLSPVQTWAWISVAIIGVITFIISLTGVIIGIRVGKLFKEKASVATIVGGAILILLAVKMVLSGYGLLPF